MYLFNNLKTHQRFPETLKPIYDYFETMYIRGMLSTRYSIEFWNCYRVFMDNEIVRTHNAIEGWHSIFSSLFLTSKNSMIGLIAKLKDEEDAIRIKAIRMSLGH